MPCQSPPHLPSQDRLSPLRCCLFISPQRPPRSLSKNIVSFFLREVIHDAGVARPEVGSVCEHSIRGVSTSAAFHCNWSVSSLLESAIWRTNSVFASFYFWDIQHEVNVIRHFKLYAVLVLFSPT